MKVHCPKCRKLVEYEGNEFRPFCSKRCKTNDLGDWASEKYAVPVEKTVDEFSDENEDEKNNSEEDQG